MRVIAFKFIYILFLIFIFEKPAFGKTIIVKGNLDAKIHIIQQMHFNVNRPLKEFRYRFGLPLSFKTRTVSQQIENLKLYINPTPLWIRDDYDRFGNHFKIAYWKGLAQDISVQIEFDVLLRNKVSTLRSSAYMPPGVFPPDVMLYLSPTKQVQSNSPEIKALAYSLTRGAGSEYEAVASIIGYVVDNIKYTYNPPEYDALYTLHTKKGNCQNFAHLSLALLRAAGIPARIVGGISLRQPWKIPIDKKTSIVQSMGQGGHAWIEVYYPDIGWLPYDPQQSMEFTSTRYIKQTQGLDSDDINDTWKASPYIPDYSDNIESRFLKDTIALVPVRYRKTPRAYLLGSPFQAKMLLAGKTLLPEKKAYISKKGKIEFGNTEFPSLVDLYKIVNSKGVRVLDKETAEYVTSQYVYAQAFEISEPLRILKISLAMHKFGGDGTIYIDLVKDRNGVPSFSGTRSLPLFLEDIKRGPGYYWVNFSFPEPVKLQPGRYWIVLRHSGDVIMNWFYIPGNPYGQPDDTRSTKQGYRWQYILNYDFVFKVTALRK